MLKKNKWNIILSNVIILLPLVAGLLFQDRLASLIPQQFRVFSLILLPLFMLVLQWVCILFTLSDKGNKDQSPKVIGLIFWLVPMINCFAVGTVYLALLGGTAGITGGTFLLMGGMFVIIGNFMPKCKQNSTMGIKIKWTLESEENWNATHRLAGKVWTVGGFLMMLLVFLPVKYLIAGLFIPLGLMVLIPTVYSYRFYKKQVQEDADSITPYVMPKALGKAKWISLISVAAILIFCVVIMFVGKVEVDCADNALYIEATFFDDYSVGYDEIEKMEYRPEGAAGVRVYGFGSAKLQLGFFESEEFGGYTRYTTGKANGCIVLWMADDHDVVILSGNSPQETKAIYETLLRKGVGQ